MSTESAEGFPRPEAATSHAPEAARASSCRAAPCGRTRVAGYMARKPPLEAIVPTVPFLKYRMAAPSRSSTFGRRSTRLVANVTSVTSRGSSSSAAASRRRCSTTSIELSLQGHPAADLGSDSCGHLLGGEWLDQVVVSAAFEAEDAVRYGTLAR